MQIAFASQELRTQVRRVRAEGTTCCGALGNELG